MSSPWKKLEHLQALPVGYLFIYILLRQTMKMWIGWREVWRVWDSFIQCILVCDMLAERCRRKEQQAIEQGKIGLWAALLKPCIPSWTDLYLLNVFVRPSDVPWSHAPLLLLPSSFVFSVVPLIICVCRTLFPPKNMFYPWSTVFSCKLESSFEKVVFYY